MVDEYYSEYPLVIKLFEPVELKSICLGFHTLDNISTTRVLGVPENVIIEGGLNESEM